MGINRTYLEQKKTQREEGCLIAAFKMLKGGGRVKNFDIESIELSMHQLKEIRAEVRRELEKKQAYYAKLCGIDRQMINAIVS